MHSPFQKIREATRVAAARIESGPFERAMLDGTLTAVRRASLVRALHTVYAELDHAAATCTLDAVRELKPRFRARISQLERESTEAGADLRHVDAAVLRALVLAQRIRRDAAQSPAGLIGHIYVFEASERPLLPGAPAIAAAPLEAELSGPGAIDDASAAAQHALEGLEAVLDVIVSNQLDDQLAGALNSEAGTHPVPADVREVRAALAAGEQTWNTWRYYEARYGERGLRFTRSDSAWLVTLAREDREHVVRQIAWLGRVLAARGMPRILLERHLIQLHAQLTAELPDRAQSYEPLARAAGELARERTAVLSETDSETLARLFATRAATQSPISSLEAGRLLVAAVIDETRGISQAVESLCSWLVDPERFSRDAVEHTLRRARTACKEGVMP